MNFITRKNFTPSGVTLDASLFEGIFGVQNTQVFRTDPGDTVSLNREASLPSASEEF
jgi:hypothetical protein